MSSFLLDVEPDFRVRELKTVVNQNVTQTKENQHHVSLRLAVCAIELAS